MELKVKLLSCKQLITARCVFSFRSTICVTSRSWKLSFCLGDQPEECSHFSSTCPDDSHLSQKGTHALGDLPLSSRPYLPTCLPVFSCDRSPVFCHSLPGDSPQRWQFELANRQFPLSVGDNEERLRLKRERERDSKRVGERDIISRYTFR